jgi:hypothetical protein
MLCDYKISDHITKQGFITNYLVWHQDGEMKAPATDESNENDDKDWMDDMIADIGMEYDIGSEDQHPPLEV